MDEENPNQTAPTPEPEPAPQPAPRTRLSDRAFGVRSVAAVALATLILGGLGGAAVGVVASGDDHSGRSDRGAPVQGEGRFGDDEGGPGRPPRQLPPSTAPEDDSDSGADNT